MISEVDQPDIEVTLPGAEFSRRHFIIGGLLVAAPAATYLALPQVRYKRIESKTFESWIPKQFGAWSVEGTSGVVVPSPDAMSDRLYDNLVTRVYQMPGAPAVMMLIAYNNKQDGVLQLHRPEICYQAGGFSLSPIAQLPLSLRAGRKLTANVFTASGPDRIEQVLYWTRLGEHFPLTWLDQRLSVVRANLRGIIPDGLMMRVSLFGTERNGAVETLEKFLSDFVGAINPSLQRILIGEK